MANSHSVFTIVKPSKTKTEKQSKEIVLQTVTLEATINVAHYNFLNNAYIIFSVSICKPLQEFIQECILCPTFTNSFLQILFTRITPTKAP